MNKFMLTLLSAVTLSAPAMAQEEVASLLVPSSAWMVGPTTLDDGSPAEGGGMPCVMVNKFSNNVEMRLSGGGDEILAMALNVGEKTFETDQSYLMTITFEGQDAIKLPAQAFSEDTIVVGTDPGKDFYKSLQASQSMVVNLGASTMEFSMLGVPQGLKRLEECYKPLPLAAVAPAQAAPTQNTKAPGMRRLDPEDEKKIDEMIDQAASDALPATPAEPEVKKESELVPQKPEVKAEAPKPQPAPQPPKEVKPRDILTPGTATAVTGEGQQMRWRVMKGANLQSIFEVWSQSAQARLIWNAGQGFSVPESLAMQGTFEGAVEAILGQFPTDAARPVGKIYIDPTLKQKILVIEADKPAVPSTAEGNYAPIGAP